MKAIIHVENEVNNEKDYRLLTAKAFRALVHQGRARNLNPTICLRDTMEILLGMVYIDAKIMAEDAKIDKILKTLPKDISDKITAEEIFRAMVEIQVVKTINDKSLEGIKPDAKI